MMSTAITYWTVLNVPSNRKAIATTAPRATRMRRRQGDRSVAVATATAATTIVIALALCTCDRRSTHSHEVKSRLKNQTRPTVINSVTILPPNATTATRAVPNRYSAQPIPTAMKISASTYLPGLGSKNDEVTMVHHLPSSNAGTPKATSWYQDFRAA